MYLKKEDMKNPLLKLCLLSLLLFSCFDFRSMQAQDDSCNVLIGGSTAAGAGFLCCIIAVSLLCCFKEKYPSRLISQVIFGRKCQRKLKS